MVCSRTIHALKTNKDPHLWKLSCWHWASFRQMCLTGLLCRKKNGRREDYLSHFGLLNERWNVALNKTQENNFPSFLKGSKNFHNLELQNLKIMLLRREYSIRSPCLELEKLKTDIKVYCRTSYILLVWNQNFVFYLVWVIFENFRFS